jgi:oxygen-independent coproporphyrinogen III oxidase
MADMRERLEIAWESREGLLRAGFVPIGMDHFALPGDELAVAAGSHGLHRNFQGYCTSARAGQVYALGASGISQLHAGYIQNAKDPDRYLAAVNAGRLSHENAYRRRPRDLAIRNIINGLLCDGEARIEASLDAEGIDGEWKQAYLEASMANLDPLLTDGLAILEGGVIRLTANGRFASRAVASAFDPMLKPDTDQLQPRYSQAL